VQPTTPSSKVLSSDTDMTARRRGKRMGGRRNKALVFTPKG
jgi:hypothetical protein